MAVAKISGEEEEDEEGERMLCGVSSRDFATGWSDRPIVSLAKFSYVTML
jgi:hypothetical protein